MDEGPYRLPKPWRWVRLRDVAWRDSTTVKPCDTPDQTFSYLGMEHVTPGQWQPPEPESVPGSKIKSSVVVFRPGHVLYGKLRPYLNKVVVPLSEGVASAEFVPILTNHELLSPKYLAAFLRSPGFVAYASKNTTGSRQPRVRLNALWDALVPLPPLLEQNQIVARIEALMEQVYEARRLHHEAKSEAEHLLQAVLAEVFPRPGTELPSGWRWAKLVEVVEHQRRSIDPRRFPEETFMLYSIPAYDNGTKPDVVYGGEVGSSKLLIEKGTCLFSKLNPRLPRAWIVHEADDDLRRIASTEFMPLKPRTNAMDLTCLGKVLMSRTFLDQVSRSVTGATGSRQRLNPTVVLDSIIPLPPISEQRRIAEYLDDIQDKVSALKEVQTAAEAELDRLEQAFLDRAFRGEL